MQFGELRASTSFSDREDLDYFAYFERAELDYSFEYSWSPRLVAQFDYASGDDDPDDSDNNRFDTLFGVRRFDFGPLGIYGPFARAYIISPRICLQIESKSDVSMFIARRGYWLASDRDAWTVAKIRDPAGDSGNFLDQQTEARLRWDIYPNNLSWEFGEAYLFKSEFAEDTLNVNSQGDFNLYFHFN